MIEIAITINAPLEVVWEKYTSVGDVQYWAFASDDWAAEGIENNLTVGGGIKNRNFAKDGSAEFMFSGVYTEVMPGKRLGYMLDDGRKVEVDFIDNGDTVELRQRFDPESGNPEEMQKDGWQAYLSNFKKHVESTDK